MSSGDGVRKFLAKVFEAQDVLEFEPEEYFAQGEKVVVLGNFTMRLKPTGTEFSSLWAHAWTLRDGKVAHFYEYVDTAVVRRTLRRRRSERQLKNQIDMFRFDDDSLAFLRLADKVVVLEFVHSTM